jgi:hypothetical protein
MKLFKFIIGLVIFLLAVGIVGAGYELYSGGPWYTYKNYLDEHVIFGQDVRTTYQVYDESGKLIDTIPAYKFQDEAPNAFIKGSNGVLRDKDPVKLPGWISTTNVVMNPLLKVGHYIDDNVVNFAKSLK